MKIKVGFIVAFHLLAFLCFRVPQTHAQSQSLSIYPPVIEVQTTTPSSPSVPIIIQNNDDEDVKLTILLVPIKQFGATGEVRLVPEQMTKGFYSYYRDRIQFLDQGIKTSSIDLLALESKEIVLNINLSKGDPPGDYYYSIVFISDGTSPKETSSTKIPAGLATNLLLSIGPKSEAIGGISEFKTQSFRSKGPVNFNLKVHNGSNHLISPAGSIEIRNMFGSKVGNVEILPQYILGGSDRLLVDDTKSTNSAALEDQNNDFMPSVLWKEEFLLGWYKATATIMLEENARPIEAVVYFFAFPLYFFIPLAILLFVAISIYLRVRRKI